MNPLIAALAQPPPDCAGLAVAYSGGLDSTCLLHALWRAESRVPLRAIHVCHHLQPQSEAWALSCAQQCRVWGIDFARVDIAVEQAGRGLEAAAREARYRALAGVLAPGEVLVSAHHARDQAETFLIQALRGAGVAGLAGMPELACLGSGRLWRPWRHVDRDSILAYARGARLEWVEDPSNRDHAIDRGHIRESVWPAIVRRWPAAAGTLSRSAAWAAQAAEAIQALAAIDLARAETGRSDLCIATLRSLSLSRQTEALRLWLRRAERDTPDHRHMEQILALLCVSEHNSPRVSFADTEIRRFDGRLFVMPRLPEAPRGVRRLWHATRSLPLPSGAGTLRWTGLPGAMPALFVTFRRGGERVIVANGRSRALKDVLREARIPPWLRERIPLIYLDDTLVAIGDRWRHPAFGRLLGTPPAGFAWQHALVGDPARVVETPALG